MTSDDIGELRSSLEILNGKMDVFKEDIHEIKDGVKEINKSLYDPDVGVYTRVKDQQLLCEQRSVSDAKERVAKLEMEASRNSEFRKGIVRLKWLIVAAIVTILVSSIAAGFSFQSLAASSNSDHNLNEPQVEQIDKK